LCEFSPNAINLVEGKLLPPGSRLSDGRMHFFGTDSTGRDLFARILFGGRLSLVMGLVPVAIAFAIGVPIGLISGYRGGKTDQFLMRFVDLLLAFPSILLALIVVSFLGQGLFNLMIAVGLSYAPSFARFVRGSVVAERSKEYINSAAALGSGHVRIMFRHILPNCAGPIIVVFTMNFASALLEAAGLSFLGLGVQPPTAEWGSMLAEGKNYFYDGWWVIVLPGVFIFLTVLSLNIVGDSLRDALDPKSRRRR
jgi:ABC-type dipeptide/oligopeptide/nickel transport system permease subunit